MLTRWCRCEATSVRYCRDSTERRLHGAPFLQGSYSPARCDVSVTASRTLSLGQGPLTVITPPVIIDTVIRSFADAGTEDVFDGIDSKAARARCPTTLLAVARRKLDQLQRVRSLADLGTPPGNRLQSLRGDRAGQWSVRINDQYRICFRWEDGHAEDVEITDYHS